MQLFISFNKPIKPLFFLVLLLFTSCKYVDPCYSKDAFIAHLEETIDEVKKNGNSYSTADWELMDKKVEKIIDDCYEKYKGDLSDKEKEQISKQAITYIYQRQKNKMEDLVDSIENMDLDLKAKELMDEADDQIKDIFNEVLKDDLDKVVDSALDEFEKLAKELKEKWNESKNQ